jgi:hypothetical protein
MANPMATAAMLVSRTWRPAVMQRSTSGSGARSSKKPHAFEPLLDEIAESPQRGLSMARMFDETPSLRARHIGRQLTWHDGLTPQIARRLQVTDDPYDPRPAPWSPPHSRA